MYSSGPLHEHLPEWHKPPQNRKNYFRLYVNFKLMMDGNVLIVDDEPDLLELTKIYLEKTGEFAVDIAESAREALEKMQTSTYAAVVSDYEMPEMNGIEFLKTVRGSGSDMPFIIFTGKGREDVVIEAINNGADFYLQKGGNPKAQFA